jgi:hypothetical protein
MLYYRVKPKYDGHPKYVVCCGNIVVDGNLVGEELYTPAERKGIVNADKFFEKVNVSQRNTHWFFGARFENPEVCQR